MKEKRWYPLIATVLGMACLLIVFGQKPLTVFAKEKTVDIGGKVFVFEAKDHYDYQSSKSSEVATAKTAYGNFTIFGDLQADGQKAGMPSFAVNGESASLTYTYGDVLLNAEDTSWHIVEDKTNTVAGITFDSNIKKGALILQTSKDGRKWFNDVKQTNIFEEIPKQSQSFYSANSIQLANGCYYRLIVAYETGRKVGQDQVLFVKTDQVEYKKTAEVYKFYLHSAQQPSNDNTKKKTLGSVVNTGKDNGYSGSSPLNIKDPHYGWQIGEFFVSGYTRETEDDRTPVFLKNPGDQITLWFNLRQDIDALDGKSILCINEDSNGYDQYFQTAKTNMGRGALIIRYTDENGVKHDPEIYTNYLAANATTSANTVVKLFEEGDYEVALDYEIKKTPRKVGSIEVVPEYTDYRIFFNFKVRNGNCKVYIFDVTDDEGLVELTDEAITPNGFRLDLAKSKYLDIDVTRAVVTEGANGYVEDIRFNRPAKDGDQYTDEGIYTISVKNLYTGNADPMKIYVGDTAYMRALSTNKITVSELNDQIGQGGIIEDDGRITLPSQLTELGTNEPVTSEVEISTQEAEEAISESEGEKKPEDSTASENVVSKDTPILLAILSSLLGGVVAAYISMKKKKSDGGPLE